MHGTISKMTFHKYKKIRQLGHEENKNIFYDPDDKIVIEEKIDGANFRFMVSEDGKLIFGSRSQELFEDGDHAYQKNFDRCVQHIAEKHKLKPQRFQSGNIYYGENCVKHTLSYDWDKIPIFLGFDVYDIKNEKFYDNAETIFDFLGLDYVPIIKKVKASEIQNFSDADVPVSKYRESVNGLAEGVVFKNYSKQIYAKYVREKFKEENSKTFGGSPKYGNEDDSSNLVHKYCTNARIDKMIFKLIDDGNELDMPLMKFLPGAVNGDIWEEHYQDIYTSRIKLDMHKMHKLVTKRCLFVLRQVITNNALQKIRSN